MTHTNETPRKEIDLENDFENGQLLGGRYENIYLHRSVFDGAWSVRETQTHPGDDAWLVSRDPILVIDPISTRTKIMSLCAVFEDALYGEEVDGRFEPSWEARALLDTLLDSGSVEFFEDDQEEEEDDQE